MIVRKFALLLLLASCVQAAHASIAVGLCRPSPKHFSTISDAIAAASPGEEIDVCPGVYAEQLQIRKPLAIDGVVIPGQPGVTILPPAAGLQDMPAGSGNYPQVYIDHAGGLVKLRNLSIKGNGANILYSGVAFPLVPACQIGFLSDFPGIYSVSTNTLVEHVSVSGHLISIGSPDQAGPRLDPNCGSGMEFLNQGEPVQVLKSVVDGFGLSGIYASGNLTADHNVLTSAGGPYQIGIQADATAIITNNTVVLGQFLNTVGIFGGKTVEGNIVQSAFYGIQQAHLVLHNTLLNNAIGISGAYEASDNLITASSRYLDPRCAGGACAPSDSYKQTVGIDMDCSDVSLVRDNGIVGVGDGLANVKPSEDFSPTNLFANVRTSSTACTQ